MLNQQIAQAVAVDGTPLIRWVSMGPGLGCYSTVSSITRAPICRIVSFAFCSSVDSETSPVAANLLCEGTQRVVVSEDQSLEVRQ